jgi:peptidoglycan/xylan/chitin deacetylase (PgdA/CDA1 family)
MFEAHTDFIRYGKSEEYLTWKELEAMKDVFSFGSHGYNHFSYPYEPSIQDFFDGNNFHWTLLLYSKHLQKGIPIFKTRSELAIRKFNPSRELIEFCISFPKKGNDWKSILMKEVQNKLDSLGEVESEEEAYKRINEILHKSKLQIEEKLSVKVDTFAWPFGQYSKFSTKLASNHYKFLFTIKKGFLNLDTNIKEIPRISLGKDIFTILGRILTFSSYTLFNIYKFLKPGKVIK